MKKKKLGLLTCVVLLMGLFSFTSCSFDTYDDYLRNTESRLCDKVWVEEYTTNDNDLCKHTLAFFGNGKGEEVYYYFSEGAKKAYRTDALSFEWLWLDSTKEGLALSFGKDDEIYFDNIWVREHNLSGKLDGELVVFVDADYYN